jgi:hypothetical protein
MDVKVENNELKKEKKKNDEVLRRKLSWKRNGRLQAK